MKKANFLVFLMTTLLVSGCVSLYTTNKGLSDSYKTYSGKYFSFQYPPSWEVSDMNDNGAKVENPEGYSYNGLSYKTYFKVSRIPEKITLEELQGIVENSFVSVNATFVSSGDKKILGYDAKFYHVSFDFKGLRTNNKIVIFTDAQGFGYQLLYSGPEPIFSNYDSSYDNFVESFKIK